MNDLSSLYWIARCDGCGKPLTAHAMSVLREAMLCLDCLNVESQAIAEQLGRGRIVLFAHEADLEHALPDATNLALGTLQLPRH